MKPPSLSKVLSGGLSSSLVCVMAAGAQTPPPPVKASNSIEFVAASPSGGAIQPFEGAAAAIAEARERLQDPQKRAALRTEERASLVESHYGVAEALALNEAQFEKLMDVLADQRMTQLEQFHLHMSKPAGPQERRDHQKELHARVASEIEGLREVLGEQKLERYQALQVSLSHRLEVRALDDRLDTPHKLSTTQREQLVQLSFDHTMQQLEQHRPTFAAMRFPFGVPLQTMPSHEELQRSSELLTIESNEENWRRMPESHRQLRAQAAAFLTAPQLAALELTHAEREMQLQRYLEQKRSQVGLSPTIPEQHEPAPAPLPTVAGKVKLSMTVIVNGGPPGSFAKVVSSGKPVSFEIDDGLIVQATTSLFENDMYDLRLKFYEKGRTGLRAIGNLGQAGEIVRAAADHPSRHVDSGGSTVIAGKKAYTLEVSSLIEPI